MSTRQCTSRAEWRLRTGKPAEALSAHYRLDCDYGTAVIICWAEGGTEPIYLCGSHAKQLGRSREHSPDARVITAQSDDSNNPVRLDDRTQTQEAAAVKPQDSGSLDTTRSLTATTGGGAASDASVRKPVRDLTYGNSAKAMVDEAIWNMAPGDYQVYKTALQQGKSASEAAQAAGGQVAVIHRKISDYTLKLEGILSASTATINVGETIDKPLEHAVLEIISSGRMTDSEKDSAVEQLGALQEWAKQGLKGDITPLQASGIMLAIGDRLNWGGTTGLPEKFKPVYRALYGSLKAAIRTAVPEAQELHDRLTNLYAAKSELEIC